MYPRNTLYDQGIFGISRRVAEGSGVGILERTAIGARADILLVQAGEGRAGTYQGFDVAGFRVGGIVAGPAIEAHVAVSRGQRNIDQRRLCRRAVSAEQKQSDRD